MLAQYITIGRETTDADFLARKIELETPAFKKAIEEILSIKSDDGLTFSWSGSEKLIQPHMNYPGIRVNIDVKLEKMRDKIQLDIGIGDSVEEVENNFQPFLYKGKPLFSGEITLMTYPIESIFAEKLETIMSKGANNSRMKDYHDVLLMIREPELLDKKSIQETVQNTFKNRETIFKAPITFDKSGMEFLEKQWAVHLRNVKKFKDSLKLPDKLQEALDELNTWLVEVF